MIELRSKSGTKRLLCHPQTGKNLAVGPALTRIFVPELEQTRGRSRIPEQKYRSYRWTFRRFWMSCARNESNWKKQYSVWRDWRVDADAVAAGPRRGWLRQRSAGVRQEARTRRRASRRRLRLPPRKSWFSAFSGSAISFITGGPLNGESFYGYKRYFLRRS